MTKSTESGVDTLWQWDAAGNLTRRATTGGETWEYLWDARDKMTKVRKQPYGGAMADVASYTYDAMGRRFQKTSGGATTTYYQDGLTPVVEARNGLTKRHRAYEGDLGNVVQTVDGTNNTFYAYDARLGNAVATFGTDGLLKQSYTSYGMDAFGNVYAGNPENFGLTTKQLDADTGLYYFNARWYEGASGIFFSYDALLDFLPTDEDDTFNLYTLCDSNPTNYYDDDGEKKKKKNHTPKTKKPRVTKPKPPKGVISKLIPNLKKGGRIAGRFGGAVIPLWKAGNCSACLGALLGMELGAVTGGGDFWDVVCDMVRNDDGLAGRCSGCFGTSLIPDMGPLADGVCATQAAILGGLGCPIGCPSTCK